MKAKPSLLRAINLRTTFDLVHGGGPLAAPHVVRSTGLSKPTVSEVLSQLVDAGLLRKTGRTSGLPGPSAQLYDVNPRAGWVLSLDVGHERVRGALTDLSDTATGRLSLPTSHSSARAVIAQLREAGERLTREAGIALSDVNQVVVGTPGVVRPGADHMSLAPQLAGWESPTVIPAIRELLRAPVVFENDVNMAAVGEHEDGVARGVGDFVLMSVGTGVGTGVFVDGGLRRGAAGLAGEIAFLRLDIDADVPHGHRAGWSTGAYEEMVRSAAIVALARAAGLHDAGSVEAIFAAARRGDRRALQVVEAEARRLAHGIAAVAAVLDPELVVLGGGIGTGGGDLLLEPVRAALAAISPFTPRLAISKLGVDAVIAGCAATGLRLAIDRIFASDSIGSWSAADVLSA
ncbi:MAG TPA: ROK family transcriptional regulator [Candidatus Dormibacteraeota bacterium]|nr:ROK family transcriptional regulator [Candidatus Dormibacteraeota bacterium]